MKNLFGLYVFVSTQNKILGMHSAPTNVVRIKSCVSLAVDVHFSRFLEKKKKKHDERASFIMFNSFSFGLGVAVRNKSETNCIHSS